MNYNRLKMTCMNINELMYEYELKKFLNYN